jgi:general secretion pathway protein A
MYKEFFGLTLKPFELVPNPRFLFLSRSHQKAINYLEYGICNQAGFILFTGEVGSGKTTILRNLIRSVDPTTEISMVFNTRIDSRQLIALINEDFGLHVDGKDIQGLLRELNDFLIDQHAQGRHPIIIIDEAQNLSVDALEEVRLLSNLETDEYKLVQIILVGQPELRDHINHPDLLQLKQRINIHCHLDTLSREETEEYIFHRLAIAGNRDALVFAEGVFDLIFGFSTGVPRLVNLICDFILLAAFVEETNNLSLNLVSEVIGDVAMEKDEPVPSTNKPADVEICTTQACNSLNRHLVIRISGLMDEVQKLDQKLKPLEDVLSYIGQQQRRINRVEVLLGRFEKILATAHQDSAGRGQLVEMKEVTKTKDKVGILSRLFE